jgi:hydrogenase-4 component B
MGPPYCGAGIPLIMTLLLPFALIFPLMLALGWSLPSLRLSITRFAPWASLPALAASLWLPVGTELEVPWLLLGSRFGLETTGAAFLSFTALLWWLIGVYGLNYQANDPQRDRFFFFFLLAMSSNLGLTLAQDMLSFLLLFAMMSISAYGLVIHHGDPQGRRAGRIYLSMVIIGEVCLFSAVVLLAAEKGTLEIGRLSPASSDPEILGLLLIGFGIKLGLPPLHFSLPIAYAAMPLPGAAALGGAMLNAGLLGWLRFLPLGQVALPAWSTGLITAGIVAAFYGVLIGLAQRNPKALLAYSSISQMGLVTTGIGIGLAAPQHWPLILTTITVFALHHALAKSALFLGLGLVPYSSGIWTKLALLFPALALAGAPFTSGAIAKTALKSLTPLAPVPWEAWLPGFLLLSAMGTTLLMGQFIYLTWPRPKNDGRRLPFLLGLPWAVLLLAVNFTTWLWPLATPMAAASLKLVSIGLTLGPVLLGVSLSLFLRVRLSIPAGDIVIPIERLLVFLITWTNSAITLIIHFRSQAEILFQALYRHWEQGSTLKKTESFFRAWSNFGLLFLAITLILFLMLL